MQPILLISDLDDTVKISNTESMLSTVYRGLFRSSAFAGMADLYQEILRNPDSQFWIVSSSPPAIIKKIDYFIQKNKFPKANIQLRDWIRQSSILKYKLKSIQSLVEASKLPVILVGDDTEHDATVFAHVAKKYPEKIIARYIHVVTGAALPDGSTPYFTAFDLACAELSKGRLSNEQVLRVGEAVLRAEKNSRLIPKFSLKPPLQYVPFLSAVDHTIVELWEKISAKIESMPKRKAKK